jgi:hypothetical protein
MQVGVIPSHGWGSNRNQLLSIAAPLIQNIFGRRGPRGEGRGTLAAGRGALAAGTYDIFCNFRSCLLAPDTGPSNVERQSQSQEKLFFLIFK